MANPMTWSDIFPEADARLIRRFVEFHIANPQVFQEFRKRAGEMKATGRKKYSAWVIIQIVRWHCDLATVGDVFKINNDFIALYARLLMAEHPRFQDFFELRRMKPIRRQISREEAERRSK